MNHFNFLLSYFKTAVTLTPTGVAISWSIWFKLNFISIEVVSTKNLNCSRNFYRNTFQNSFEQSLSASGRITFMLF